MTPSDAGPAAAATPEDIAALLSEAYDLRGDIVPLGGSGENYRVLAPTGESFVLKIAPRGMASDAVALEHLAVDAAASAGLGLAWPTTRPTTLGEVEAVFARGSREGLRARLLDHVPGTPWCEAGPASAARRRDLGRVLGALDRALAVVELPAERPTHEWDLTQAGAHRERVALVADRERRRILERAFHGHAAANVRLQALPAQIIHGDVNDENVLVEGDRVVGLVDFGDVLVVPAVCELAIALAYAMLDPADPLAAGAEIVGAYHRERPLAAAELELLFPLVSGRLAVTATIAAARRLVSPDHPTWFVTEARAWRLLERLAEIDPADGGTALSRETGIDPFAGRGAPAASLVGRRLAHVSGALSISYRTPLKMVRGRGQFLFDERGRPFLDLVNNICHVGHCHPRVVEAGQAQMARLNTNTRYLSDLLVEYAERLVATLPDPLDTCIFVNSGSEANELAIRMARTATGRRDMLVVDGAYHGHTPTLVALSPYKFMGRGGAGRAEPWVHVAALPDGYRGRHRGADEQTGLAYADDLGRVIAAMGTRPAAWLTESIQSCGGQIVPPPGYFKAAADHVRAAGGLVIVDEVQTGFGRVGRRFWAFELQDIVPDIVVIGKPMGNGHPMGAVITTKALARAFENGMEFFSSFGGNPVSCAIGLEVLNVIREEALEARALDLGGRLMDGLRGLMDAHPVIGDVRGEGLFIGVELVADRETREPAARAADDLVNRLAERGILASTDGPAHNVIKIKPPLVIQAGDIDMVIRVLDEELP